MGRYLPEISLLVVFLNLSHLAYNQKADSLKAERHIGGSVAVTNNGISFIPNFTLGKPAAIFDLSVGGKRLSFEPQFRFSLEGKPWSFLFWWRYKLVESGKWRINAGAHPAVLFKTRTILVDSVSEDIIEVQRYLAGELSPSYLLSKNISIGLYYLVSHGFEKESIDQTHFLSLRASFSEIRLSEQFFMKFNPQLYFLKMDKNHGFYFTSSLTLARKNFPLSVSSLMNATLDTNIPGSKPFIWNVSLIYAVNRQYIEK